MVRRQFEASRIPGELHAIVPFAEIWAICDDIERTMYIGQAANSEKRAFYDAVSEKFDLIETF